MTKVNVIGAGLAGTEACYQLAKRGFDVNLYEMKPLAHSPAHHSDNFCELVCSNSLKGKSVTNACGLLKEELRKLDSIVMRCADKTQVPAGGALAVDRELFSTLATEEIIAMKNVTIHSEIVEKPFDGEYNIIATGPLTHGGLYDYLSETTHKLAHFYDAAAPIVFAESIDYSKAFYGDRYGHGTSDYLNCPMTKDEYLAFYDSLVGAELATLHDFESKEIFEGCMPIEVMAKRGVDTIRFGPLKPVGLLNNGERAYAVLQLRKENEAGTLFNLVGCQTNLKFGEQKRVFSLIPALKNAEFAKYGVMHRNTFVNAPNCLENGCKLIGADKVYLAGQITGVEGYVESVMSGLYCALQVAAEINEGAMFSLSTKTMTGALINYLKTPNVNFQPMNANFGIIDGLDCIIRNKEERYSRIAEIALTEISKTICQ